MRSPRGHVIGRAVLVHLLAREIPLPGGGGEISLATDRPVSFWEARNPGRSMDYEFSLAEIRLPAEGKGEGKAIRAGS